MSEEWLGIAGTLQPDARAMVYRSIPDNPHAPEQFYFCCLTCGACGKVWRGEEYAVVQAIMHLETNDHTPYLEKHNVEEERAERQDDPGTPPALQPGSDGG